MQLGPEREMEQRKLSVLTVWIILREKKNIFPPEDLEELRLKLSWWCKRDCTPPRCGCQAPRRRSLNSPHARSSLAPKLCLLPCVNARSNLTPHTICRQPPNLAPGALRGERAHTDHFYRCWRRHPGAQPPHNSSHHKQLPIKDETGFKGNIFLSEICSFSSDLNPPKRRENVQHIQIPLTVNQKLTWRIIINSKCCHSNRANMQVSAKGSFKNYLKLIQSNKGWMRQNDVAYSKNYISYTINNSLKYAKKMKTIVFFLRSMFSSLR